MTRRVLPWKIARKLSGLSQGDAARQAGVDQSHWSKVERRQTIAGPDFASAMWSVVGVPHAPVVLASTVRDPSSLESSVGEEWCVGLADILDQIDPRWMTYLVQRWFPDRKFLPAFPPEDGPGLIWWYAAWSHALDVPIPVALVDQPHPARVPEVVRTFQHWAASVASKAQGQQSPSIPSPGAFPPDSDLWNQLEPDEKAAVMLLVRHLAAGHRPR